MSTDKEKAPVCSGSPSKCNNHQVNYTNFLVFVEEVFPEGGFIEFRTFAPGKNPVRDFSGPEIMRVSKPTSQIIR